MPDISELSHQLSQVIHSGDLQETKKLIRKYQYADIAEVLNTFPTAQLVKFFQMISSHIGARVLSYLNSKQQNALIKALKPSFLKPIISSLYTDDLVDLIDNIKPDSVTKILNVTSPKRRAELNNILRHDEESAGGMMSTKPIHAKEKDTVAKTIKYLQQNREEFEYINTIFIEDSYGFFKGSLSLEKLFFANPRQKMFELKETHTATVNTEADREVVINIFQKYDIEVLPVLDKQKKMVGFITVDDVLDGLIEESTEDITQLAGIRPKDEAFFNISVWNMLKSRSLWLIFMIIFGTLSQIIILFFWGAFGIANVTTVVDNRDFAAIVLLAPMLLVIAGLCGTAANQSSTIMVRALSLYDLKRKEIGKAIWRDFATALWLGIWLAAINVVRLIIIYLIEFGTIDSAILWKAIGISSLTIWLGMLLGSLLGNLIPVCWKLMHWNPTLASTPLITTLLDLIIVGLLFGLGLAFF